MICRFCRYLWIVHKAATYVQCEYKCKNRHPIAYVWMLLIRTQCLWQSVTQIQCLWWSVTQIQCLWLSFTQIPTTFSQGNVAKLPNSVSKFDLPLIKFITPSLLGVAAGDVQTALIKSDVCILGRSGIVYLSPTVNLSQIFNIIRTTSQNFNASRLVLQLSLCKC